MSQSPRILGCEPYQRWRHDAATGRFEVHRAGVASHQGLRPATSSLRWSRRVGLIALVITVLLAGAMRSTGRAFGQPTNISGVNTQAGWFNICEYSHSSMDDPIVYPGQPGASHMHDFYGAVTTDAYSTYDSLLGSASSCDNPDDRSGYWQPALYDKSGNAVKPLEIHAYWIADKNVDPPTIKTIPPGLKVIAGDAHAHAPLPLHIVSYGCTTDLAPNQEAPFDCSPWPGTSVLGHIQFPSCWDGTNLDSPDHKSHMAYPSEHTNGCPADHPVAIPRLSVDMSWDIVDGTGASLSSGAYYTLHADFFNAWVPNVLAKLVHDCVNADIWCGNERGDRPPKIKGSVEVTPQPVYDTNDLTATASTYDPDGDEVTLSCSWTVNNVVISAPCTLGSDRAGPGDVIVATVTPIDSLGMSGTPVSSQPLTDLADIRPSTGQPGRTVCGLRGGGWGPVERVDLHVDAESGTKVGSVTTDDTGQFSQGRMTLPSPLPGGIHDLVGVGLTSGLVYQSSVTVTSIGALVPNRVAAGDATVFAGDGFVPGETVTAAFPNGGQSVSGVAAADGSVSLSLTSPPEPAPGGNVTVVAPSGTFTEPYFTKSAMTLPDSAEPGDQVPVLATGFGPNESVKVRFERGSVTQTFTSDSVGTVSGSLLIATTYGKPQVTLTGLSSRVRASAFISLPAQMTLSPTAGKVGTVVTVTSGPGWVAGETLRLYWAGTLLKKLTASQKGTISKTFTVPKHSPGDANVKLQDDLLNQLASATFTVKP